jgi:hypothetical protein
MLYFGADEVATNVPNRTNWRFRYRRWSTNDFDLLGRTYQA